MINIKLALILAVSLFVPSGSINLSSQDAGGAQCLTHKTSGQCPMHKNGEDCLGYMASMAHAQVPPPENPDGSRDTPTHRWSPGDGCSRLDPDAPNKKRDGVKENTVACACTKKCVNGQTQEDMSKDENDVYICRNASHKDRCFCPDPCKN